MRKTFLMFAFGIFLPTLIFASEVVLKSGKKVDGKIIEQTDKYVKIDAGIGTGVTYYMDDIDTIDGQKASAPASVQPAPFNPSIVPPQANAQTAQVPGMPASCGEVVQCLAQLKDRNALSRAEALGELAQMKDPRVLDALIAGSQDPDIQVRTVAVVSLLQINDPKTVEPLIAVVKDPHSGNCKLVAIQGLMQAKDPRAVDALIGALKDHDHVVRRAAIQALDQFNDSRALNPLIETLKTDTDANVREWAASELGKIKDPSAVDPLIIGLKDTDLTVRQSAAQALADIRDPRGLHAVEEYRQELQK